MASYLRAWRHQAEADLDRYSEDPGLKFYDPIGPLSLRYRGVQKTKQLDQGVIANLSYMHCSEENRDWTKRHGLIVYALLTQNLSLK